ncbi:MAG: thioredoxin [Gammaproteobacteria bacterium]|nr:thioredoxin [Gammaproteobacteria bacterium]MDH3413820.1 thioredoxin [Gammaproteobacteria bacterium]
MDTQALIFDVDEDAFQYQVIEVSHQTPVLVDFWAEWCAPCRALAPVLEKVVTALAGRVLLAKVNTDKNQKLASALAIQSLPTVKLIKQGRVVDEFFGAYAEAQVREFLSRHLEVESDDISEQAQALLRSGNTEQALALLREAVDAGPENFGLKLDLAAAAIAHGDYSNAEATLRGLPAEKQQDEKAKRLFALLHFYHLCEHAPSADDLERKVAQDPKDLDSRLKLSARNVLEENYEAAMDHLLEVIRSKKNYRDGLARKSMLSVFELIGSKNPLVGRYRSLMATVIN